MSLLLLTEDKDKEAFKTLAKKICKVAMDTIFVMKGDMLNTQKVETHVRLHLKSHKRTTKVLVCRDSECTPIEESKRLCSEVEQSLTGKLPVPITYIVVDHSLEGWLMADVEAIGQILGAKVAIPNPEGDCQPAERLRQLFRKKGKVFDKSLHNPRLAALANPKTISENSPTFQEFVAAINDP